MAPGKNATGRTPMSKTGSKSPAPAPGRNIKFSIQSPAAKYGKGPKARG